MQRRRTISEVEDNACGGAGERGGDNGGNSGGGELIKRKKMTVWMEREMKWRTGKKIVGGKVMEKVEGKELEG